MAKSANDRFETALAFAAALEAASRGALSEELRVHAARVLDKTPWDAGA
jgi:hypothetical protein